MELDSTWLGADTAAVSTCGAAERLASRVWRNALSGPSAGFYSGHPSRAPPTAGQMACPVTRLVPSLTGRNGYVRIQDVSTTSGSRAGMKAKGMLSQHRLLRLFQQKAGEGAWRSCASRPPTVQMGKSDPHRGGGLPPPRAPAVAFWDTGRCQS